MSENTIEVKIFQDTMYNKSLHGLSSIRPFLSQPPPQEVLLQLSHENRVNKFLHMGFL